MRSALSLLLLVLVLPVQAGETPWQELAPGVRARLVSADVLETAGTTMVGFELDMPENTKIYWRIPGETGIAPQFEFGGGATGHTTFWPYPMIETDQGYLDYVYYGPTVLPISLAIEGDSPVVELAVTLGVCSDFCVPASASFSLPLNFARPDTGHALRIRQAVSLAPIPWDGPAPAIDRVSLNAAADGLDVTIADPAVDPRSLIADIGDPATLFGAPRKSRDGRSVFLPLSGSSTGLEHQQVRITFMTGNGPYEMVLPIEPASTESAD